MNTKAHFEFTAGEKNEFLADMMNCHLNSICDSFYYCTRSGERKLNKELIKMLGVDVDEPVNWGGGISASVDAERLKKDHNNIVVIIEEASPESCPTLCGYFADVLTGMGFSSVEVITEW